MRFKMIYVIAALLILSICGVGYGTVTTGLTGQREQRDWDNSQILGDGIASDAVVYYNFTTGLVELDDAYAVGAAVPVAAVAGSIAFWETGTPGWDSSIVGEIIWADPELTLLIGADAATYVDEAFIVVSDATFTGVLGDDFYAIITDVTITGGTTGAGDWIYGLSASIDMNDPGGTVGDVTGIRSLSTMTNATGTATDVIGALMQTTVTAGSHQDTYGIFSNTDIAAAATTTGSGYGIYNLIDNDNAIAGSVWGQLTDVNQVLGAITGNLFGTSIDLDMTATSAANSIGLLVASTYDGAITMGDDILGISNIVTLTAVTTVTDDLFGMSNTVLIADAIGDDVFGFNTVITHTAGVITGDIFGIRNNADIASTAALANIYGEQQILTTDTAASGTIWGELNDVNHVAGAVTADVRALEVDLDVTGGSAVDYYGIKNPSTYNNSTASGDIYGFFNLVDILAGTFALTDDLFGISSTVNIADDCGDDVHGILTDITQTAGVITGDVFGIKNTADVASTATPANMYGEWQFVDSDSNIAGSLWGELNNTNLTLGTVSSFVFGLDVNTDIQGGTVTADAISIRNNLEVSGGIVSTSAYALDNQLVLSGGTLSTSTYGIFNAVTQVAGTNVAVDIFGAATTVSYDADVAGDVYGERINMDGVTGTVTGNVYGLFITSDSDGTVGGDDYGVYLNEDTGIEFGYYQNGSAMNHLEGGYESPWVAMTITNAANDNAVLPDGQHFRITVTAADNASEIGGLTTGTDGRVVTLLNFTAAETITIEDNEIAEGGGFSPILTCAIGGDIALAGFSNVTLIYSSADAAWIVVGFEA